MKKKFVSLVLTVFLLIANCGNLYAEAAENQHIYLASSHVKNYFDQINKNIDDVLTPKFMPLISLLHQAQAPKDFIELRIWFQQARLILKNEGMLMYLLSGLQFGSFAEQLYKDRHNSVAYRNNANQYDIELAYPMLIADGLQLIRPLEGKENYNATNAVKNTIKAMVSLLGYKTYAEEWGGFPHGYLAVATSLGLTDNMTFNPDDEITNEMWFQLATNALSIPLCLTENEIKTGLRDANRLLYTDDEKGEVCDGTGPSGTYATLLNMHFRSCLVEGALEREGDGYKYVVSKIKNVAGAEIPQKVSNEISIRNIGDIPFETLLGKESEAVIQFNPTDGAAMLGIRCFEDIKKTGYSLSIETKEGKNVGQSTVNNQQGTGDTFLFTAVTAPEVNQISLLADKFNGTEWHEIPFSYLQQNYHLEAHINSDNQKVWTCRFGINDPGIRTFILKTDGYETSIKANVKVLDNISVLVSGKELVFDVPPQIINDRTMVPLRVIFEALGAEVYWNGETQTVTANNGDMWVSLTIGKNVMHCAQPNASYDEQVALDAPPVIIDGRTLIPVRAVAEAFNMKVDWDPVTKTVTVNKYFE